MHTRIEQSDNDDDSEENGFTPDEFDRIPCFRYYSDDPGQRNRVFNR